MIPEILHIGPLPINSFGLMVALSLIVGSYRLHLSFKNIGLDPEKSESYIFWGGISGLVGARIWYLIFSFKYVLIDPIHTIFATAGFTFLGGFIFATGVLYLKCKKDKIPFVTFLDAACSTMLIGYAVGRLGCQLSGDGDYGILTRSVFGMSYLTGVIPTAPGLYALPTPLYESTICILFLLIIIPLEKKLSINSNGYILGVYLLLTSIERFVIEYIRIEPKIFYGLSQAQLLSIFLMIIGASLVYRNEQKKIL